MKLQRAATAMAHGGTTAPLPGSMNVSALASNPTARRFDALCSHSNAQLLSEGGSVVRDRMWKVSCEGYENLELLQSEVKPLITRVKM